MTISPTLQHNIGTTPSHGLRRKAITLLAILAVMSLSPTTVDFLIAAFLGANIPLGTYAFFGYVILTLLLALSGSANRAATINSAILFILCLALAATSLWSPSTSYLATKLPLVVVTPTVLFLSGFMISSSGGAVDIGKSVIGFGLVILLGIWIFGAETIVGFQVGLDDEFGGRYQSISRVLAVAVIACFTFFASNSSGWKRAFLLATSVMLALQILYSGGRVGFLILFITIPIVTASLLRGRNMLLALALWIALSLLFVYVLDLRAIAEMIWPTQMPLTIDRILMEFGDTSATQFQALQRNNLWLAAIEIWQENPLLGVGLAGFPIHAGFGDSLGVYPHNIVLELAAETGLLGLALFVSFSLYCIFRGNFEGVPRIDRLVAIGVLASGLAISSVISDFGLQRELFIGLGLISGLKNRNFQ